MATITPVILQNNQRKDGRWVVVFRLTHKRKSVYIKTSHLIKEIQLNKDKTIKQKFVIDYLAKDINELHEKVSRLGLKAETYTASQLKDILTATSEVIDFIKFCDACLLELKKELKPNTIGTYLTIINHLKDYQQGVILNASDITAKYIIAFLDYIKKPKSIKRMVGKDSSQESQRETKIRSGNSLNTAYFRFSRLFDLCKEKYNDEDIGIIRIPNNPFSRVPVPKMVQTKKRSLSVEDIRKLIEYQAIGWSEMVGKNIFLLSFYLCGINVVDLRNNIHNAKERFEYNRSKIENRRKDRGFISILVPNEAKPFIDWYTTIAGKWSNSNNLVATSNKGLRSIAKKIGIDNDISTYYARHSFATIARNDLRINKEDIAMALNHVDNEHKATDIYLKTDWSIIDDVQRSVIDLIHQR